MSETKPVKLARRDEATWRRVLAKHAASALSIEAFCQREGISTASDYRWRKLFGAQAVARRASHRAAPQASTPEFLDLGTLDAVAKSNPRFELTLDLGAGVTLTLVRH